MQIEKLWKPYQGQDKGKLIYQSEAIIDQMSASTAVQVYEHMIYADKSCLHFCFDLKFTSKPDEICFEMNQQSTTLKLLNNDHKQWRNVLKRYLNQRGFHEAFKPIKKIGKGNFASVYLAQNMEDQKKYAVKAFSKEAAYSQQNGKQCLIKQIDIMRHLNNPNLMKLEEVYQSDNSLYIIFELLQGGHLHGKLKERKVFHSWETRKMVQGLLQGLEAMHSLRIMHRDLKPENILIREKEGLQLVIADFGLAQFADSDPYLFVRCGTPGFVAPEVINIKDMNKKYSPVCDMFSLGLIFHILLLGRSPFTSKTYDQVLVQNRACQFDFKAEMYSGLPSETLDLLEKMLRLNPQQRITAQEALGHPYFKMQQLQVSSISPISTHKTSIDTSSSFKSPKLAKDSCLEFKLAKENIMNGRTDTIADVGETKVSMIGKSMGPTRISRISKFTRGN